MKWSEARYIVKTDGGKLVLRIMDMIHLKSDLGYTHFFFKDGSKKTLSRSLGHHLKKLLQFGCFARLNRSHAVNIHYVSGMESTGMVELTNDIKVPATKALLAQLEEMLRRL